MIVGRLPHDKVRRLLRRARFLAIPSSCEENAPLAAIEALSEARPLLVTRTGGLPELAEEGKGRICDPGDTGAMAEAIRCLMDDEGGCYAAGEKALAFYRQALDPTAHRRGLEATYRRATDPAPASTEAGGQ
jgi:glycosyltransferase involved in cell wall biosynthesis